MILEASENAANATATICVALLDTPGPNVSQLICLLHIYLVNMSLVDSTCELLPPRRSSASIGEATIAKIAIHLSTRYSRPLEVIRRHFTADSVELWARVRRLEGGDVMYASSLRRRSLEDSRDATFIRVCTSHCFSVGSCLHF